LAACATWVSRITSAAGRSAVWAGEDMASVFYAIDD
jgi:hypothetical protein